LRGLPLFLVPSVVSAGICFGILWFCILSACPYHLILEDFINCTISAPYKISFISLFVFILQLKLENSTCFGVQYAHTQVYQSTHKLYKLWLNMAKKLFHAHIGRENTYVYLVINS
jgi:hypothetical protein